MLQHLPFVARNAVRNRRRSILTLVSVAVSLCLLGMLLALYRQLFYPDEASPSQALRLIVHHRVSLAQALPGAYEQRLRGVPGVVAATTWQWFGGVYKDSRDTKNFFARLGVNPEDFFKVRSDLNVPMDQKEKFTRERTGAIASRTLVDNLGWKMGERITIVGDIFPVTLELKLVGIFDDPEKGDVLFYNDKYLQESLTSAGQKDWVGAFLLLADQPENVPRIGKAIDHLFDNSPSPTKTESERDFALSFLAFLGNLKMFLAAISAAVTFTILLVSANTVAMTVRERIRETAILRTLGFTPAEIRGLIVAEAFMLSAIGGVIGSLGAQALCSAFHNGSTIRLPLLTPELVAGMIAVAMLIGIISAIFPAYFASHRPVVESLRYSG